MRTINFALALTAVATVGCATVTPGQIMPRAPKGPYDANPSILTMPPPVVYQDSRGPNSYQAPTPAEVQRTSEDRTVKTEVCQSGLYLPPLLFVTASIGWEEGGYMKGMQELQRMAGDKVLYDLMADLRHFSILGIYRKQCLVVSARVSTTSWGSPQAFTPAPSSVPAAL
jgi:hypothetical protein